MSADLPVAAGEARVLQTKGEGKGDACLVKEQGMKCQRVKTCQSPRVRHECCTGRGERGRTLITEQRIESTSENLPVAAGEAPVRATDVSRD